MANTIRLCCMLLALPLMAVPGFAQTPAADRGAGPPPPVKTGPALKIGPALKTGPEVKPGPETKAQTPQWPKTIGDAKASGLPQAAHWSPAEIEAAQAQCAVLLKGLDAVVVPATPIREGDCGTPAPVELISIGHSPQITFSQPALVTCDMVVALSKWFNDSVQPAARAHLGGPIVRVQVMSAYSCRNAYGRKKTRLSEHGRANALDIGGFLTDRSVAVELAQGWGMTARDVRAQVAAAEAAKRLAEQRDAEKRATEKTAQAKAAAGTPQPGAPQPVPGEPTELRGAIADTRPVIPLPRVPDLGIVKRDPQSFSLTPPSRLGGPKPAAKEPRKGAAEAKPPVATSAAQQLFLRRIHASACQIFGTVLGPEANEAHRNHFHLDMAERTTGGYCE